MAKINCQLVLNLANDLMVVQKVVADLARKVGEPDIAPRRPPQCIKPAPATRSIRRQVRRDNPSTTSAPDCAQHLLFLELLYDRSQAVARLFLLWLYKLITSLEEKVELPELSDSNGLGHLFEQLSYSAQYLNDVVCQTSRRCCLHSSKCLIAEQKSADKYRSERGSQASSALRCCESCREMQELIKGVVKSLQVQLGDGCQTTRTRTEVRAELSTLSQLGATHRLVDAVNKDVCALLDAVAESSLTASAAERKAVREAEIRSGIQGVLEETEKLLQDSEKKASLAQTEIVQLRNIIAEMERISQTAAEESALKEEQRTRTEKELKAAMLTIWDLGEQLSSQRSQAVQKVSEAQTVLLKVKSEKATVSEELKAILQRESTLQAEIALERSLTNALKEELKKERIKKHERELYTSELEMKFSHLNEILKESSSNKEIMKIRLSESVLAADALRLRAEEEKRIAQSECEDLREKLRAMADHEALLISYPDFHGPLERCEGGDPVVDMESQVRANELRVRLLNEQTARLRVTLEKLRRLTAIPKRSVNEPPQPPKTAPAAQWAACDENSSDDDDDSCKKMYRGKTRFHPHSWSD